MDKLDTMPVHHDCLHAATVFPVNARHVVRLHAWEQAWRCKAAGRGGDACRIWLLSELCEQRYQAYLHKSRIQLLLGRMRN